MTVERRRVALLARPGVASDRLQEVLAEAGVLNVLQADPTRLDTPELMASDPQVVLVALDTATEDVLERFDAVLGDPAIDVIYEEADLAVGREGWDAARWKRHLVAKLQGHKDFWPPGAEPLPAGDAAFAPVQPTAYSSFDPVNAEGSDLEFGDFELSFELDAVAPAPGAEPPAAYEFDATFDPQIAEQAAQALQDLPRGAGDAEQRRPSQEGALQFDGFDPGSFDPDASFDVADAPSVALESAAPPRGSFGDSGLELSLDDGAGIAMTAEARAGDDRFQHDLADIERRISSMQLVDDSPAQGPEQARGVVVVLAGIGGPDAVRQLLGALPSDFPRPVLVRQRLDGGRYDKLVAQMQRATRLPVKLAQAGMQASAGNIYISPPDLGLLAADTGMTFVNSDELLANLPSGDSAILLLSGSDVADIDAVMKHQWAGALVAGQSPDGCYDAVAPTELAARGGDTGQPSELARRLVERWPA
ncbi:MAG: chemotaxis protein [Pseudomonadota bacterium]|nr:chemotaxis protein [Pseudomonadota bacterium]